MDRTQLLIDGAVHRTSLLAGEIADIIDAVPECRLAVLKALRLRLNTGVGRGHPKTAVNGGKATAALAEARALRETNGHVVATKKKRTMTPALRKAMSKRMKLQWAAAKAAGVTNGARGQGLPSYDQIAQAKAKHPMSKRGKANIAKGRREQIARERAAKVARAAKAVTDSQPAPVASNAA